MILLACLLSSEGCKNGLQYNWVEDSLEEIIISNDDKLILVDFETESCVWCDRLDADTFTDERVIDFAKNNLISKKIDAEKEMGLSRKKSIE